MKSFVSSIIIPVWWEIIMAIALAAMLYLFIQKSVALYRECAERDTLEQKVIQLARILQLHPDWVKELPRWYQDSKNIVVVEEERQYISGSKSLLDALDSKQLVHMGHSGGGYIKCWLNHQTYSVFIYPIIISKQEKQDVVQKTWFVCAAFSLSL